MELWGDGEGVFEAVKITAGKPFALQRHIDRLVASGRALGLPTVAPAEVRGAVEQALDVEDLPTLARIRITLTRSGAAAEVAVTLGPLAPPEPTASVVTAPWPRNEGGALTGHKALDYVDEVAALTYAKARGATEAILLDGRANVCEGTTSNLFYVVDGELRTPALSTGCLPGVSRALVLEWYGARECEDPLAVALGASEVFLTSTTRDVQPVVGWDDAHFEPGPVTAAVATQWRRRTQPRSTQLPRELRAIQAGVVARRPREHMPGVSGAWATPPTRPNGGA